ncbi:hypothetical protein CC2G_013534 [Coprinopsis cinerea AmutBmut pab1-1]|nr:hypothetical protein CC2G_013534 [Coprinopsis cinerea AmutBmut pab1-1]
MSPLDNTNPNTTHKTDEAPASQANVAATTPQVVTLEEVEALRARLAAEVAEKERLLQEVEKKRADEAAKAEEPGGATGKGEEEVGTAGGDVEMSGSSSSEDEDGPRTRASARELPTPTKRALPTASVSVVVPALRMVLTKRAQAPREKRKRVDAFVRHLRLRTNGPPPEGKHRYYPRNRWQWNGILPHWDGNKSSAHVDDFHDPATAPRSSARASARHGRPRPAASGSAAPQPAGLPEFLTKAGKFMKFIGDFAERVDFRDAVLLEEMRGTRAAAESGANDLRRLVELMEAQQVPGRYWQPGPPASEASTSDYFGSGRGRKSRSGGRKGSGGGGAGAEESSGRGF